MTEAATHHLHPHGRLVRPQTLIQSSVEFANSLSTATRRTASWPSRNAPAVYLGKDIKTGADLVWWFVKDKILMESPITEPPELGEAFLLNNS